MGLLAPAGLEADGGGDGYLPQAVDPSARPQEIAKGGDIIVGESTFEVVKDRFGLEPVGEVSLKNIIRPLSCYRLKFE